MQSLKAFWTFFDPKDAQPSASLKAFNNFFKLKNWKPFYKVNRDQARQMISKSNTLRLVGRGSVVQLFTKMVPKNKMRKK